MGAQSLKKVVLTRLGPFLLFPFIGKEEDRVKLECTKNEFLWECLQKNGYIATYLVTDEGRGLCAAQKEALADIFRQLDR